MSFSRDPWILFWASRVFRKYAQVCLSCKVSPSGFRSGRHAPVADVLFPAGEAVGQQLMPSCHSVAKELTRQEFVSGMQDLRRSVGAPQASPTELSELFDHLRAQPGGGADSSRVSFFQWIHCLQPHSVGRGSLSVFKDVRTTPARSASPSSPNSLILHGLRVDP